MLDKTVCDKPITVELEHGWRLVYGGRGVGSGEIPADAKRIEIGILRSKLTIKADDRQLYALPL